MAIQTYIVEDCPVYGAAQLDFPGTKLLINLDIIGEKDVRESLPLNVSLISKAGARQAAEAVVEAILMGRSLVVVAAV